MDSEIPAPLEQLEKRLMLMRELAAALEQAQAAVVASDLERIHSQTARQQELCQELTRLGVPAGTGSPAVQSRWDALSGELAKVETEVEYLNRVHASLLRRARRTLEIFSRVLASSAVTYAPPTMASAAQQFCARK
jgi:hypothetical protein